MQRNLSACRFFSILFCNLTLLLGIFLVRSTPAQLRAIEDQIPKNVPIKVKIKNQGSKKWAHDLEVIVTNTGKKPIYYLFLSLTLDVKAEDGNTRGFALIFGNGALISFEVMANQKDPAILPNESYTFKINGNSAKGWDLREAKGDFVEPRKGFLSLGSLSFGDGSGHLGGGTYIKKKTILVFEI